MTDRAKLLALCDAAAPGPWEYEEHPATSIIRGPRWLTLDNKQESVKWGGSDDDGRFIAAANPAAIRALIEELAKTERERDESEAEIARLTRIVAECHEAIGENAASDDDTLAQAVDVHVRERSARIEEQESTIARLAGDVARLERELKEWHAVYGAEKQGSAVLPMNVLRRARKYMELPAWAKVNIDPDHVVEAAEFYETCNAVDAVIATAPQAPQTGEGARAALAASEERAERLEKAVLDLYEAIAAMPLRRLRAGHPAIGILGKYCDMAREIGKSRAALAQGREVADA